MRKNFKSYGAWHHRKWILSKGHSSIDNELRLLDAFQKADPRNFHAWNYRRLKILFHFFYKIFQLCNLKDFFSMLMPFSGPYVTSFRFVTALMKRSDEDELKYTEEVIGANFSNYSAWHNRRYDYDHPKV